MTKHSPLRCAAFSLLALLSVSCGGARTPEPDSVADFRARIASAESKGNWPKVWHLAKSFKAKHPHSWRIHPLSQHEADLKREAAIPFDLKAERRPLFKILAGPAYTELTDAQLKALVLDCRERAVRRMEELTSDGRHALLLDEYAADVFKYLAGSNRYFDSVDSRIEDFHKRIQDGQYPDLNLRFAYLWISGGREVRTFSCTYKQGLEILSTSDR